MAQEQIPLTAVIVDDGGYGMLRYDQALAGDARPTASTCTRRTSRRWPPPSASRAETVDGLDDAFGEALAAPRRGPRAVACSSPARRTRSCRRRTRRRTGTAAGAARGPSPCRSCLAPRARKSRSAGSSTTSIWAFWSLPA